MIWLDARPFRVDAGAYGVFAVPDRGGRRRPLLTVEEGETFQGLPLPGWRLLAVPLRPSSLSPVPSADPAWWERLARSAGAPENDAGSLGPTLGQHLDRAVEEEIEERGRRTAIRDARDAQQKQALLRDFTALAAPGGHVALETSEPLLAAARRVARAQRFEVVAPVRKEGSFSQHPLLDVARASRCRARRVELVGSWWKTEGPPLVGFLRADGAPVAILHERGRYVLVDANGERTLLDAARAAALTSEAWMLMRPLPEGPVALPGLVRFALEGRGPDILRASLWGLCATLAGLAVPVATGFVVDTLIPDADRSGMLAVGLGLLALTIGATSFQLAESVALLRIDVGTEVSAQSALWDRLLRLSPSFFRNYASGDLLERVSAASAVGQRMTDLTLKTLLRSALALLNVFVLWAYSPNLTLVAVLMALLIVTLTIGPALAIVSHARKLVALRGKLFGALIGLIEGVAKLRSAGAEERGFTHWARLYRQQLEAQVQAWQKEDRVAVLGVALPGLAMMVLFASAGPLASPQLKTAALTTGAFLGFQGAFGQFLAALTGLSGAILDVVHIRAEAERARPILEASPEVLTGDADPGSLAGGLRLDRLVFRYRPDGPPILDQLSLSIEPGSFVAIVGASGCGKSTLLRLILGFETPASGRILYDGQDLSGLNREAVRRQIGVVLQSGRLMPGSLFENVAGAKRISLDDAWQALRLAGLEDEVRAMPMGLHTVIGAEGALSGGQRQRLLIARALVGKPRILLLDEATSALDNHSQALVNANLEALSLTRIAIAHRLSTVRSADRIVVLDAGRVVQQGTFHELMAVDGHFRRLAERQLG
jgi:NHLM bacteriocin system ABC transporter ATP-binding protein